LDQTGQGEHSLPCVASFIGSEDREVHKEDVQDHHADPAESFGRARKHMCVTETVQHSREKGEKTGSEGRGVRKGNVIDHSLDRRLGHEDLRSSGVSAQEIQHEHVQQLQADL
jgi:hypothetical protein